MREKDQTKIINKIISLLPTTKQKVPKEFTFISPITIHSVVEKNIQSNELPTKIKTDTNKFAPILTELSKYKGQLGGSPVFGTKIPTINRFDSNRHFFGIPVSAVKDWFAATLKKKWKPHFFWKTTARLFNIHANNQMSQYEETYTRIQRFEVLIANKERFYEILDTKDKNRYKELGLITGMAWHPDQNSPATEKMYIEFIEQFLTTYFQDAQKKGPNALIKYFKAFSGVCLEDRARELEEYAKQHKLEGQSIDTVPPDWDTGKPVEEAYMKEAQELGIMLQDLPTPTQLFEHLKKKGVFDLTFPTVDGKRVKPSKEGFDTWAKEQVEACILDEEESSQLKPHTTNKEKEVIAPIMFKPIAATTSNSIKSSNLNVKKPLKRSHSLMLFKSGKKILAKNAQKKVKKPLKRAQSLILLKFGETTNKTPNSPKTSKIKKM